MLLPLLIMIPSMGAVAILLAPRNNTLLIKKLSYFSTLLAFLLSTFLWFNFDSRLVTTQQEYDNGGWLDSPGLHINFFLAVDGISLVFIMLTTFIFPICMLISWDNIVNNEDVGDYMIKLLLLESLLIIVFSATDLIVFYMAFESILIPLVLMVGVSGSNRRKVRATYLLYFYTLFSAILLLVGILAVYHDAGTTNYANLLLHDFGEIKQKILWLAFFIAFATKIPMYPFHNWLLEAHVEAPTAGSVILAGVLLKMGVYGLIRFTIPLFPEATIFFTPFVFALAIIGIVCASFSALRQTDLKKAIAYASIAHMNLIVLGLFSGTMEAFQGALMQVVSHGLTSSGLFICIGLIYNRFGSRSLKYYSGIATAMPRLSVIFLFLTWANMALPGTANFIGEFLMFTGIYSVNATLAVFTLTCVVLSGAYSLWLYNRICYGNLKRVYIGLDLDLSRREFAALVPIAVLVFVLGMYGQVLFDMFALSSGRYFIQGEVTYHIIKSTDLVIHPVVKASEDCAEKYEFLDYLRIDVGGKKPPFKWSPGSMYSVTESTEDAIWNTEKRRVNAGCILLIEEYILKLEHAKAALSISMHRLKQLDIIVEVYTTLVESEFFLDSTFQAREILDNLERLQKLYVMTVEADKETYGNSYAFLERVLLQLKDAKACGWNKSITDSDIEAMLSKHGLVTYKHALAMNNDPSIDYIQKF